MQQKWNVGYKTRAILSGPQCLQIVFAAWTTWIECSRRACTSMTWVCTTPVEISCWLARSNRPNWIWHWNRYVSTLHKNNIFQYMGTIFCVEFPRCPWKFHTKYRTHTWNDVCAMYLWNHEAMYRWTVISTYTSFETLITHVDTYTQIVTSQGR